MLIIFVRLIFDEKKTTKVILLGSKHSLTENIFINGVKYKNHRKRKKRALLESTLKILKSNAITDLGTLRNNSNNALLIGNYVMCIVLLL